MGSLAGSTNQGSAAIAIGFNAGAGTQGTNSIAIGTLAGRASQGTGAIAIGAFAGQTSQNQNSIVINASGSVLNSAANSACYINPLRVTTNTTSRLVMYDTATSELWYSGANAGNASKTFVIDHPINKEKYLVHGCLEGPESGVYYRGKDTIVDKHVTIELPDYTKAFTDFSIQVTPIFDKSMSDKKHYVSEVEDNKFTVYGPPGKFFWTVFGKRLDIIVEPYKKDIIVDGNGPYKWIKEFKK
jgi:hypothetical protein